MGYIISNLHELPKIFNWHLFLINNDEYDDYDISYVPDFFRREFLAIATDLGAYAAIISGDNLRTDLNKLLPYHYEFAESLYNLQRKHSGLLMIDGEAMSFLMAKSDLPQYSLFNLDRTQTNTRNGNIYFIPYKSIEFAYHSERELFRDLLHFTERGDNRLLRKTERYTKELCNGTLVQEFNRKWCHPSFGARATHLSDSDYDYHLYNTMMIALSNIENNRLYRSLLEDEINDVLKGHLNITPHWSVHDQTRQGSSETSARSGELDLLLKDQSKLDIAIIEALCLTSVDKTKISGHFKKMLINYDPLGVPIYSLVVYSRCANFGRFWTNLLNYLNSELIPDMTNQQPTLNTHVRYSPSNNITEKGRQYASLRHAQGVLNRSGRSAYIHIYALDLH